MKLLLNSAYIIGISLGSLSFFLSFLSLIALNGLGDIFIMVEAPSAKTEIEKDEKTIKIKYVYQVNSQEYTEAYIMASDYFTKQNVDTIVIKYNQDFPSISYIKGIPLKTRKQKIHMIISVFFILFFAIPMKMGNSNRSVGNYMEALNRPWVYPMNRSINNPFKRFLSIFFNKDD